jgi:catechol 2,3-dioxygenase-like lactoylglutathione lyase family enzyme
VAQVPKVARVIETGIYVADVERSAAFYEQLFHFPRLFADDRLIALDAGGQSVLLIFRRGGSTSAVPFGGGFLPPHDGSGTSHFAFGIERGEVGAWEEELGRQGVPVETKIRWPRGGESLYFRDPDGHLVELMTPGVWATY